jgi:hypothetical protein
VAAFFLAATCTAMQTSQAAQVAQGGSGDTSQYLYGTWYTYPPGDAKSDSVRHEFRHNRTTDRDEVVVTRICPGDYRAAIAKAISPIEVTESTIRVLKRASATEKGEMNSECKATVEPGLWSYTISDDHNRLTITEPGGHPDIVELARQDAVGGDVLPSTLYGTWSLPVQNDRDTKVQMRLIFYAGADPSKGKVRQIATCMKGNNTLVSQADSEIRVTANQIRILNAASHVQRDGPFTCEVTITPGTLRYVLSRAGDTMTLISSTGGSLKVRRETETGSNP